MNLNWRFVSFPCEDTRFKRIFTDDRRDGMSSESKRSIHWCRTIQSSYDFTDTQKTRSGHEGLDESHGKNHSTAFYRFPSRRVVFYERERESSQMIQAYTGTLKKHLQIWVCVGGATHVGGFKGGVCSASVKRFSDQSSQTQTNVSISNEIWSLNLFMMKSQKENTVFQFLLLVISFKPHLNDFTWF